MPMWEQLHNILFLGKNSVRICIKKFFRKCFYVYKPAFTNKHNTIGNLSNVKSCPSLYLGEDVIPRIKFSIYVYFKSMH